MKKKEAAAAGNKPERKQKGDVYAKAVKIVTFCVMLVILVTFCVCSKWLPRIGDADSPPNTHVSDYYISHSEEDTGAKNIVSGTLADYRGFDTMFETSVMFVSGLVVTMLLVQEKKGGRAG